MTVTLLTDGVADGTGSPDSFVTSAFSPSANKILGVWWGLTRSTAQMPPVVTLNGGDYPLVDVVNGLGNRQYCGLRLAPTGPSPPASQTVTFDISLTGSLDTGWYVFEMDTLGDGLSAGQNVTSPWYAWPLDRAHGAAVTSFTTASIAPAANRMLTVLVSQRVSGTPGTPSVSGLGLTWNQVVTHTVSGARITLFNAVTGGSAPTPGTLSITWGGASQTAANYFIHEWSGHDTGLSAAALVQTSATIANNGTISFSQNQPDNMTYSAVAHASVSSTIERRAGTDTVNFWTHLDDNATIGTSGGCFTSVAWTDTDEDPDWNAGSTSAYFGLGAEFIAAASTLTPRIMVQGVFATVSATTVTVDMATFASEANLCIAGCQKETTVPSPSAPLTDIGSHSGSTTNKDETAYHTGSVDPTWTWSGTNGGGAIGAELAQALVAGGAYWGLHMA